MKKLLCAIAFIAMTITAFGQNSDKKLNLTEGTRYMVAFPQVWASPSEKPLPQPMQLLISSKVKTKVRIQTPAVINDNARLDREFSLQPNKVLRVSISTPYMNVNSQTRNGYGILVTSKNPISVSTYQAWMGNGELARHLPIDAWGTTYYTANMYQDRYGQNGDYKYRPSQILIVASRDNTVVSYTPTWDTEGGADNPSIRKGQTQTVTLEKGETYLIKGKIDENFNKEWSTDLSGTFIKSNKPVGVISGHTKVAILRYPDVLPPTGNFATEAHFVRNNVHDAQLPVEMSGTEFVTIPTMYTSVRANPVGETGAEIGIEDDRGDVVRFIALEDGTKIFRMRADGSAFAPERTLRRGESFIVPVMQNSTFWNSDKPVLCTQYGKSYAKVLPPAFSKDKGDNTQGHPTVEAGMPMMEYVPSVDRWTNYGVFSSPEGMDNFVNMVFKTSEMGKIRVDGRNLSSAFGGAMTSLAGTPYSTIRVPVSVGDHVIESTDPLVRWMAWTYGSLDGMQQGRAYGTPVSIDLSIPCDDSLEIETKIICGDVEGTVKLLPEGSDCARFFSFVVEDESNFILEANTDDLSDSKVFPFTLKVVDKKKSAYAKIRVVTRSGNWIEREFRYEGIDIAFQPKDVNFGTVPFGEERCTTIVVTNLSQTSITIDNLKFSKTGFRVFPNNLQLGPNDSKQLVVCGTVNLPGRLFDTLVATINCIDIKYLPVEIRGEEPVFYAGDQNWGVLPKNDKVTRKVELLNAGKVDVIVTEYQPRGDAHFTNSTLITSLPLTLKPGQRFTYDVDYSPNGETGMAHSLRINYTTNATGQKLYSDLVGKGSDAQLSVSPFSWTERVVDGYQVSKGVTGYQGVVKINNIGNAVATVISVGITGADSTSFSWKSDGTLNDAMSPNDHRTVDVFFIPTELPIRAAERKYSSEIVVKYLVNGEEKESKSFLEATALQPMTQLTNQDWGIRDVNSTTTLPIEINNKNVYAFAPLTNNEGGTMNLLVDSIVIVSQDQPFTWTSTGTKVIKFDPAITIAGLMSEEILVDFSPKSPGFYRSIYRMYGNTLDTNIAQLIGEAPGENLVRPLHMLTWIGTTTSGRVTGSVAYTTTVRFKEFRGGDYLLFSPSSGSTLLPFIADPSVDFEYGIDFTPNKVTGPGIKSGQNLNGRLPYQDTSFSTEIVFEDANGNEIIGDVSGDGKYLETTLRIVTDKNIPIGQIAKASFFLEPKPESIDSGSVESSRLRLTFDNRLITPTKTLSIPTALLTEEKNSIGMVEIDMVTPPQRDGYLGTKEFGALLGPKNNTDVDGLYYTIDKADKKGSPYVVVNVEPDVITVVPVCANVKRLTQVGGSYKMVLRDNIVDVSVASDEQLTIMTFNELGQQQVIFSGFVKRGTHSFPVTTSGLQWLVANHAYWSETMAVYVHR